MQESLPDFSVQTVGILGYGEFGAFLQRLARQYAPEVQVKIASRSHPIDEETFFSFEEVCKCDVVVLAVPISAFEDTLRKVVPHLGENSIIVDVATVKEHTVTLLQSYGDSVQYLSTHPMFGPYSFEKRGGAIDGLRMVICDHCLPEGVYAALCSFLTRSGLVLLELTPQEHDVLLAETLFLTHFIAQTMVEGRFKRTEIDTVSFGFMMDAIESVRHDTALFKDVYRFNPYCQNTLDRFEQALHKVKEQLKVCVSNKESVSVRE